VRVDVACRRRPAQRLAERVQESEELFTGREAPRDEARRALRGVPRAEMLDYGLWMHRRRRIARELAHRR
jgi:hypothetical protein